MLERIGLERLLFNLMTLTEDGYYYTRSKGEFSFETLASDWFEEESGVNWKIMEDFLLSAVYGVVDTESFQNEDVIDSVLSGIEVLHRWRKSYQAEEQLKLVALYMLAHPDKYKMDLYKKYGQVYQLVSEFIETQPVKPKIHGKVFQTWPPKVAELHHACTNDERSFS
jgi:hypothetical protein